MIKEYLKLSRSFNVGLTAIAPVLGALSNGEESFIHLLLFFLVGFFGHAYGFALNDILDYKIDKLSTELTDRPLLSGTITIRNAWAFTYTTLFLSLTCGFLIAYIYNNYFALSFLILSAISITIYDYISKKAPAMDVFVGAGILLLILFGAFAVNKNLSDLTYIIIALGTTEVLFMQFIAGGLKDAEHDYRGNANTLAIKMGVRVVERKIMIPTKFKLLAFTIEGIFLICLFYPFYYLDRFEDKFLQVILLVFFSIIMIYVSYQLVTIKLFIRDKVRRFIGLQYFINFSLVPIMLSSLNPYIVLIALIPPLAFILSNIALHGSLVPKTM